ncbi:tubulin glycylase 3B-like isoform X2 [Teleopsis dalmanni]|uniref:tubulin glycylase 3B-like isoform X2 n=1 Tax=Teleopsis dalmanni TaxID=139649 RepID=UPI0018CD9D2C|nr:tubulin glycylase 3B-like isoform X2 [Teleopsis dalmanni]
MSKESSTSPTLSTEKSTSFSSTKTTTLQETYDLLAKHLKEKLQNGTESDVSNSFTKLKKLLLCRKLFSSQLSKYKHMVQMANQKHHIFTIYGRGNLIRNTLLRRGWVEKLTTDRHQRLQHLSTEELLQQAADGNEYEVVLLSKIMKDVPAYFIWRRVGRIERRAGVYPYRNRVLRAPRLNFTTKIGLIGCTEQEMWYRKEGASNLSYPRFYRLGGIYAEHKSFIDDYRQTQCRSFMRYLWNNLMSAEVILNEREGTVPAKVVHFAVANIRKQVSMYENFTLEDEPKEDSNSIDFEWRRFIFSSNSIIFDKAKLRMAYQELSVYANEAKRCLHKLEYYKPDLKWDGCRNLWILKPGYRCRGNGVVVKKSLDDILQFASNHDTRRYIAQKYIERPHLIYKTKFDLRIYMLLIIGKEALSVWVYNDCYLRFSSQVFSMSNLKRSIHLTNNSVQKRFKNEKERDERLPRNNMWSLEQFKAYLRCHNMPDGIWEDKIFSGVCTNLSAIAMASLEDTVLTRNSFEVYGCDFMLDDNFNPILLEINANPDLSASTNVTASLCPRMMRDMMKVVVDVPEDYNASTGGFELISEFNFKWNNTKGSRPGLTIEGQTLPLCKPLPVSCVDEILISTADKKPERRQLSPVKFLVNRSSKVRPVNRFIRYS